MFQQILAAQSTNSGEYISGLSQDETDEIIETVDDDEEDQEGCSAELVGDYHSTSYR